MTQPATLISISVKSHRALTVIVMAASVGAAWALPASPAAAQVIKQEPSAEDIVRTPLEDFNIDSDEIPEALAMAARDPYASAGLESCNDIVAQIAMIDRVLGADFDIADEEQRRISRGRIAQSVVGSFVPFRGIVREVSGANSRRNEFNMAVTSGMVRRGFLKGMGQERGCEYPAAPRETRGSLTSQE